jgi:hypothetical protein
MNAAQEKSRQCHEQETSENYEVLDTQFRQLGMMAREIMQERMRSQYRGIADKLEGGVPLTLQERELVDTLIVGEARSYLKQEADFENWKSKVDRLAGQLGVLEATGVESSQQLLELQALALQARTVLPAITYYLRERERIERFESNMQTELSATSGRFLADILREMMQSSRM